TVAAGFLDKWTIDQSRHARERQHPADYLRHSYYENWLAGLETLLVETGLIDEHELRSGQITRRLREQDYIRMLKAEAVAATLAKGGPVTMDIPLEPKFAAGDRVRVRNLNPAGHTRAPRYARGKLGVVETDHGVHVFADKSAHGTREGQHLYGVRFTARELWGGEASKRDVVHIDLWDDHLEPA
ncbi:MAG: nitrile hydratase subunit beta, partial [Gammaproteobacteria bacterium]|nr:nitrile hydratase subunit beta [Gammaproteobacteria bacterium]